MFDQANITSRSPPSKIWYFSRLYRPKFSLHCSHPFKGQLSSSFTNNSMLKHPIYEFKLMFYLGNYVSDASHHQISKFMGGNTVYTTCLVIFLPLNWTIVWDSPTLRPSFGGFPGRASFGFDRGRQCILARLHGGASGWREISSRVDSMNLRLYWGQWTGFLGMIWNLQLQV